MKLLDFTKSIRKNPDRLFTLVSFITTYILFFVLFFITLRFAKLHLLMYFGVFFIIFILIILTSLISYEGSIVRSRKMHLGGNIALVILSSLMLFGVYYVSRVNASINNITVDANQATLIKTAFVSYDTTKFETIKDIDDVNVGILSNSETADRNSHVKEEIQNQSLNVSYVEYLSYNEMMLGLFGGEVEIAALPADYYNQFGETEGYAEFLDKTTTVYSFDYSKASTAESVNIDVTSEPFTILIMGNDGGRTDSMILATYNPNKLTFTMTSIPRDSYVPIACYPNQKKDKLGHAFAVSQECAIETVENLFDLNIDYYVVVNFQGVVDIVDALDRIWLVSPLQFVGQNSSDERGHFTVWVPEGGFFATGEQALAFARERHAMPGGDYQRQENQQQVIQSIIDRTLALKDVNKAINVLEAAGENIKTNMSLDQMISIFNTLINAVKKTPIDQKYILEITGSRIMGYSSYTYNDDFQLPLWISIPYVGSIQDNRNLMLSNLNEEENPPVKFSPLFNASSIFYEFDYFANVYNEKEIHENLPDFMPTMSNNGWTLAKVLVWGAERNVKITTNEVRAGNSLYNSSVEHNYIVGQSVRYGIKTSNFNTLTVDVIKHELDCKLEANMVYDECKYLLPNFVGEKLVDAKKWASENGLATSTTLILESDTSYDKTKYGLVIAQNPAEEKDIRKISSINFTIMDVYSVTIPNMSTFTEAQAKEWIKANLFNENSYVINYVATNDPAKVGYVASTVPTAGVKMKVNSTLTININAAATAMPNLLGMTKASVQSGFCATVTSLCTFTEVSTSDQTLDMTIKSQSIVANTFILNSQWSSTSVAFEVYKYVAPVTPPTPTDPSPTPTTPSN